MDLTYIIHIVSNLYRQLSCDMGTTVTLLQMKPSLSGPVLT